jgi:CDP-diacylglycerol--serine O-phosphatidyltransferase
MAAPKAPERLRRGAALLPSLFTVGNITLGFWAVMLGLQNEFRTAALAVFAAAVVDTLDGKIARMTGTESDFGRELDSLADVLTFGMAPALLAWLWGLEAFGRLGWLVPLLFLVCCASRLARFNVQSRVVDPRAFVGLPTPAAAGTVVAFLFFSPDPSWHLWIESAMLAILVLAGLLMVSTFRYPSLKGLDVKSRRSYRAVLPIAGLIALAIWRADLFFPIVTAAYTLYGPVAWSVNWLRRRTNRPEAPPR